LEKTKTLFWLAESDPIEHPDYFKAFDACYSWTWMHKTEDFYKKNQDKHILDTVLQQYNTVVDQMICCFGLPPIMMRTAGTELSTKNMAIWLKHWQYLVLHGMGCL